MGEKIFVLHAVGKMSIGGVQAFLMNYYKYIDKSKVQFGFAVQRDFSMEYDKEIEDMGGRIHKLPIMEEDLLGYIVALKNLLKEYPEYKIVHSHLNRRNLIPLTVAKHCGVPIRISHSHNIGLKQGIIKSLQENILKKLIKVYSTVNFACSNAAGEYLYGTVHKGRKRYILLKNAINSKIYRYNPILEKKFKSHMQLSDNLVFGHVGNFSEQKNYKFLIDIFYHLQTKRTESILLLIGDGPQKEKIRNYVNQLGLNNKVQFLGIRKNINELMQVMDVFIFPSLFEGLGIVAIEAQAAGIKTFVSDGVPKEVKITDLVRHIPLSNGAEVWADEILKECGNSQKKGTYKEIVESGYDIEENANWLLEYYISNYKNIIS